MRLMGDEYDKCGLEDDSDEKKIWLLQLPNFDRDISDNFLAIGFTHQMMILSK